jgi:hypothetical protein
MSHPTPAELRRMAPAARLARAVEVAAALPAHSPYADYLYWLRRWDTIAAQPSHPARPARPRADRPAAAPAHPAQLALL